MKTVVSEKKTTMVRKWGNGHGVLLPKAFVDALKLAHTEVEAVVQDSSIILTKKKSQRKRSITLKDLVRGVSRRDKHEIIDFGAPRGREVW